MTPGAENYDRQLVAAILEWSPDVKEINEFVVSCFLNRIECKTIIANSIILEEGKNGLRRPTRN
jgi:hypothetical protein